MGRRSKIRGASSSSMPPPLGSSPKASDDNKWGMLDLLTTTKNKNNPSNIHHGVGIDLSILGLDLTSSRDLFPTFASPWAEEPLKEESTYSIPACYNKHRPPPLTHALISKLSVKTLFYIFYSMPKDVYQLYAAHTLARKGWMYHKVLLLWLTKDPKQTYHKQEDNCERGSYICLNPNSWLLIRKVFFTKLNYIYFLVINLLYFSHICAKMICIIVVSWMPSH